jgi:hypothetical protein
MRRHIPEEPVTDSNSIQQQFEQLPRRTHRDYLSSRAERMRRHVRCYGIRALVSAISVCALAAGFLSAAGDTLPLVVYMIAICTLIPFILLAIAFGRLGPLYFLGLIHSRTPAIETAAERLVESKAKVGAVIRRAVVGASADDPVYGGGFRSLLGDASPIIVIPSNPRDVSRPQDLLFDLFAHHRTRSRITVDLRPFGIRLPPYSFERDLPDGVQDIDHTMAIKDIVYVSELISELSGSGSSFRSPAVWPEHCVDPMLLSEHDVIIVGGPDTNFWHAALFEPVALEFSRPKSLVPLALNLRETRGALPCYGSRSLAVRLAGTSDLAVANITGEIELDERLFPTYGMILACRNPFAAARNLSRWCVFVAGTRSLGTSGAVLALASMIRVMRSGVEENVVGMTPTLVDGLLSPVSAVLCRTTEVERAAIAGRGAILNRTTTLLPNVGLDPDYSDTYIPTAVEVLSYDGSTLSWRNFGLRRSVKP